MINFQDISVIIVVTLLTLNAHVWCFEVQVYECPCAGAHCATGSPKKGNQSTVWTTLAYTAEHNENETEFGVFSLTNKQNGVACHPDDISENIIIDFLDPDNEYGYEGELSGTSKATNEVAWIKFSRKGVLTIFDRVTVHEDFNRESFCVRRCCRLRLNSSHAAVEICCGRHSKSCIRKCCPAGYVFTNDYDQACVSANSGEKMEEWVLPMMLPTSSLSLNEHAQVKVRTGFPVCENLSVTWSSALTQFNVTRQPFRLYRDGTVQYLVGGSSGFQWKNKAEEFDYCVDTLSVPKNKRDLTCGEDEQDVLIVCSKVHVPNNGVWISRIIYMVAIALSILFLLVTAMIHFLLWEKQNIHAWTILCYVVSLTGFYLCLLAIYAEEANKRSDNSTSFFSEKGCYALGLITHFMGIFAFSWLSVINFDLWWTFRVLKPMNHQNFDWKRLICYASFAFAVPTAVVSVAVCLQLSYKKENETCRQFEESRTVYPMYGQEICFLKSSSQPYYFYLPVGVLLLANLIFYLCTSCQMLKIYNATKRLSDRNPKKQKESCELFCKLFLVMGTTWIFQVILAFVENEEAVSTWYFVLYVVLDLTNLFQAIAIFVIFVCKRETLRALEQKYTCLKTCLHPFRGMYRTPTIISRSTDGSTKLSRTEFTKHHSIDSCSSGGTPASNDRRRDSELIIFS